MSDTSTTKVMQSVGMTESDAEHVIALAACLHQVIRNVITPSIVALTLKHGDESAIALLGAAVEFGTKGDAKVGAAFLLMAEKAPADLCEALDIEPDSLDVFKQTIRERTTHLQLQANMVRAVLALRQHAKTAHTEEQTAKIDSLLDQLHQFNTASNRHN